jgi:predicted nucleic acid-binding protein
MSILDTNIVIHYLHGNEKVVALVKRHIDADKISITCINEYELMRGAKTAGDEVLKDLLGRFEIYYLDERSIAIAAEIYKKLKSSGKLIDDADILIASIAISNNEILLTADKDFKEIRSKNINIIEI